MNALIIDQFNKLIKRIKAEYLEAQLNDDVKAIEQHMYRLKQTKRALSVILSLNFEIINENDLKGIPGIGKGTLARVKEILETGKLEVLERKFAKRKQKKITGIQELLKVVGIGERLARKLVVEYGIISVDQLKQAITKGKIRVNRLVMLGLKYYSVLEKKVPRSEIQKIEKYLKKKTKEIDPKLEVIMCGSYRRGQLISGDVDVMIYHPDVKFLRQLYQLEELGLKPYLRLLIELLFQEGFLLDTMCFNKMKYMGFCDNWKRFSQRRFPSKKKSGDEKLPDSVYRIDILWMPYNSLPAATLYFTGPYQLNEQMRLKAKRMNMMLNEYGLFILNSQGNHVPLPVNSEKDIFEELGMKYLTPKEREIYALKVQK